MAETNLGDLKEHFQNECKIINLKYEYEGYTGIGANLSKKYEKHKLINKTLSKQKNFLK